VKRIVEKVVAVLLAVVLTSGIVPLGRLVTVTGAEENENVGNVIRNGHYIESVPFIYDTVYAPDSLLENEILIAKQNNKFALIGTDGTELTGFIYDSLSYGTSATGEEDNYIAEGLLLAGTHEGYSHYYGLVDIMGQQVTNIEYGGIDIFSEGLAYAYVSSYDNERNFAGYIDTTGKRVISISDPIYGSRYARGKGFHEGLAAVYTYDGWQYIDTNGQIVIQEKFEEANDFSCGLAAVKKDGKWGFINKQGEIVIPCAYGEETQDFRCGISFVTLNGQGALIDTNGDILTPFIYTYPYYTMKKESFSSEGWLLVQTGIMDDYGVIDFSGHEIVPCKYSEIEKLSQNLLIIKDKSTKRLGVINIRGNIIVPCLYTAIYPSIWTDNIFVATGAGEYIFDESGNQLTTDDLIPYGYPPDGFSDIENEMWIDGVYKGSLSEIRQSQFSDGLSKRDHRYKTGGSISNPDSYRTLKTTYSDHSGNIVLSFTTQNTYSDFSEGLAQYYDYGKQKRGYINKAGATVIPAIFDSASDFSKGYAKVEQGGKYGLISFVEDDGEGETSLYIKNVLSPTNATISNEPTGAIFHGEPVNAKISAFVSNPVTSLPIIVTPSIPGSVWTLHKMNPETIKYEELVNKQLPLNVGENYAFIELSASGFDTVIYMLQIIRGKPLEEIVLNYNKDYDDGEVKVKWGDSLFEVTSFNSGHDLALAAAALNAGGSGNATYLRGADGSYARLHFIGDKYYNYGTNDLTEHCFSIAHQEITVNGETQLLVAVILRGTDSTIEGLGDAFVKPEDDFGEYKVYNYFNSYQDKVWNAFNDYVKEQADGYDHVKVLIVGHSLGGAAANLLAARFKLESNPYVTEVSDVYAFTFGALNSIGLKNGQPQNPISGFGYIHNYFNFFDTYGPDGVGSEFFGIKPADGATTLKSKFGSVLVFEAQYRDIFTKFPFPTPPNLDEKRFANHVMACYADAVRRVINGDLKLELGQRVAFLCPVDVEVYDNAGELVGRTVNNELDESTTTIPMYVDGDEKYVWLSADEKYTFFLTAFDEGTMDYYIETVGSTEESDTAQKSFVNVSLNPGKVMRSDVSGDITIPETRLYVLDETGTAVKEVQPDGTEVDIVSKSNDAKLSGLTVSMGTLMPSFNPAITNYTARVGNGVSSITLTATKSNSGATVVGDGIHVLSVGVNRFEVTVTAEDGITKMTYVILVTRASSENNNGNNNENEGNNATDNNGNGRGGSGDLYTPVIPPSVSLTPNETPTSPLVTEPVSWINPFGDVKETDWFYNSVRYVSENGIMSGTSADLFSPNMAITRAMLVTVLYRLEGKPGVTGQNVFADVQNIQWYTNAVIWATENNIAYGYGNDLFGTNDYATREQVIAILYRYAQHKGLNVSMQSDLYQFTDTEQISDWALAAVKWAVAVGIIHGRTDKTVVPKGQATRAEVAAILNEITMIGKEIV
jgi:hypothetical protein